MSILLLIGILLLPGRALRRRRTSIHSLSNSSSEYSSCPEGHYDQPLCQQPRTLRSSEYSSCPEGHYDAPFAAKIAASRLTSEYSSCPEGHYDDSVVIVLLAIPKLSEYSSCPEGHYDSAAVSLWQNLPHQNPPPARKGITTQEDGKSLYAQSYIRIHLLPGRALRPSGAFSRLEKKLSIRIHLLPGRALRLLDFVELTAPTGDIGILLLPGRALRQVR